MIFYICFPTQNWTADIVIVSLLFCFVVIFGGDCCLNSKSDCAHTHLPHTHTHTRSHSNGLKKKYQQNEKNTTASSPSTDSLFIYSWIWYLQTILVSKQYPKKFFFFSNVEKKRWRRQINIKTIKINKVKTKKKNIFTNFVGWVR